MKFPGLIDVHVHFRDPGWEYKEDFYTGSRAALAGGFTFVIDMPNNRIPTISTERLKDKIVRSRQTAVCAIGFHYGTDGKNIKTFPRVWKNKFVFGLKVYCNHTTGDLLIEDKKIIEHVIKSWKSDKPILVHAEGEQLEIALFAAKKYRCRLHVCHIANESDVKMFRNTRRQGLFVTAGVTPHHLFLTKKDEKKLGAFGIMKPSLKTKKDQDALWEALLDKTIDLIESDHAPHTKEEKMSEKPPSGLPGLETTLGLLLKAKKDKRVTLNQIYTWLYDVPKKIFSIPTQPNTYIEFDPDEPYVPKSLDLYTKCGWSPFTGWQLFGKVRTVVFHGKEVIRKGRYVV